MFVPLVDYNRTQMDIVTRKLLSNRLLNHIPMDNKVRIYHLLVCYQKLISGNEHRPFSPNHHIFFGCYQLWELKDRYNCTQVLSPTLADIFQSIDADYRLLYWLFFCIYKNQ